MQKKTQGKMQVQTQCAIVSPFVTCAFDLVWILKILGKVEIIDGRHLEEEVKEKEGVSHMWVMSSHHIIKCDTDSALHRGGRYTLFRCMVCTMFCIFLEILINNRIAIN